jgi:hypothetical protein
MCSIKTQARSMYELVSSESAHVTTMPVMPSGMVERIAEAIHHNCQRLRVKRKKHTQAPLGAPPVAFEPIAVDGEPKSRKGE